MIIKERTLPMSIKKLEALDRRLPSEHLKKSKVENDLSRRKAGFSGEKSVDYYLKFLPEKEFFILHDLRLPFENLFFQIDTLILTSTFFLVIEIKNMAGTLLFDGTFNQLIQTSHDTEKGYPDPLAQARKQQLQLHKWLDAHHFSQVPIEYLITFTNPSSVLKITPGNRETPKRVVLIQHLYERILEYRNRYREETINPKIMKRIIKLLKREDTPASIDVLASYNIEPKELIKGVQCPKCMSIPMKRIFGTWYCPNCLIKNKSAHYQALLDYLYLIDSSITNREAREFLYLPTSDMTKKLLFSMNLPYSGSFKDRKYLLIEDLLKNSQN